MNLSKEYRDQSTWRNWDSYIEYLPINAAIWGNSNYKKGDATN